MAAKDVAVLTTDDYKTKIKAAQADAESSKASSKDKKTASDLQNKLLSDAQASYAAATSNRRATILDKLKAIKPAPVSTPDSPVVTVPGAGTAAETASSATAAPGS